MTRRILVSVTALVAVAAFVAAAYLYRDSSGGTTTAEALSPAAPVLVRPYSPVLGRADAPVTIVEFFDPACESCRAFYPFVKQIMAVFPTEVRTVIRYVQFHKQSEDAIRILEAARKQDKFTPVLERLLEHQPEWAPHGRPGVDAWTLLDGTGLDIDRARQDATLPDVDAVLAQDAADVEAVGVQATPTFFVNGRPLPQFGPQPLLELVQSEVETVAGRPVNAK